jgi:hypothetical protein
MSGISLSGELIRNVQKLLIDNDEQAKQPIIELQYMAAIMGIKLADLDTNDEEKSGLRDELFGFVKHVMDEQEPRSPEPAPPPPTEAFGIWKPAQS